MVSGNLYLNDFQLTVRTKRVMVDGTLSSEVDVISGVSQGTVLGPLMFLIYI